MGKRLKKRYVAVASEPTASGKLVAEAIRTSYKELFGLFGLAKSGLKAVRIYNERGIVVMRCFLDHLPELLLATASITELDGKTAALRSLKISGTIRGVRKAVESQD